VRMLRWVSCENSPIDSTPALCTLPPGEGRALDPPAAGGPTLEA
jgi:hypothetical protein